MGEQCKCECTIKVLHTLFTCFTLLLFNNLYDMGFWTSLASAAVPSLINGFSNLITNDSNQSNYIAAQNRANAFAQKMQQQQNQYNSLENQYAQMSRVGMNPNLLTGQSFVAASPVGNQPVSPPLNQAPQFDPTAISQSALNYANARKSNEEAITVKDLRSGQIRQQNADYNFTVANTDNAKAQLPVIQKQLDVLNTQVDLMSQQVIESDARTMYQREQTSQMRELRGTWKREADAKYREILSSIGVNGAQRAYLLSQKDYFIDLAEGVKFQNSLNKETRPLQIKLMERDGTLKTIEVLLGNTKLKRSQIELGNYETFGALQQGALTASQYLNLLNGLIELSPYERAKKDIKDFMPFTNNSPSVQPLPTSFGSGGFE